MAGGPLRALAGGAVLVAAGMALAALLGDWGGESAVVPAIALALAATALLLLRGRASDETHPLHDERARRVLDRAHDAYVEMAADGRVVAWNATAETMFGWRAEEAIGRPLADLIIPEDMREPHRRGIARFLETGHGPLVGPRAEVTAAHRDGSEIPVELTVVAINEGGEYTFHGFVRDVTERKLLAAQQAEFSSPLQHTARIDSLTALPNRSAWDEELARELARARRTRRPVCVALVDLDRFKAFNESQGHPAGDRLLRRAASSWRLAVRASDVCARYGGEEFSVLLPDCAIAEAMAVIERLRKVTPEGQTVSAGIAEWNGYESAEALVDRADFALYKAKRGGRDRAEVAA